VVRSDDGLTPEEVKSAGELLVAIFTELIVLSKDQDLKKIKIHSHDKILLACFSAFATYLATKGGWKATAYGQWIELVEVPVVV